MTTIGQIIRDARERLQWSQERLAKEVGVSRAAVGQWENNETAPTRKHAPTVAKALGLAIGAIDPRHLQSVSTVDSATFGRTIPIISWDSLTKMGRTGPQEGTLTVDPDTPADAQALRVIDDAMAPDMVTGELIVMSPSVTPIRDDIVIAQINGGHPLLRRYIPRGNDRLGQPVFDLISTAPDWPTITVNSSNPGNILGVVVSHVRKLRRP